MNDIKPTNLKIGGVFSFELVRDGEVIDTWQESNIVVDEGLNYTLAAAFASGSVSATWYVSIFKNNYTPIAANVMSTFAATSGEASADYSQATRPVWTQAGVSAKTITNSASPASFTFVNGATLYGAFLTNNNVKSGTSGILGAAARFASSRTVIATDVLNIVYTLTASST